MNSKKAKALRKLVFGATGQPKTEYEQVNAARGREVTVEYPLQYSVRNCFFQTIERVKQVVERLTFTPTGTLRCTGPRHIYHQLKNRGV